MRKYISKVVFQTRRNMLKTGFFPLTRSFYSSDSLEAVHNSCYVGHLSNTERKQLKRTEHQRVGFHSRWTPGAHFVQRDGFSLTVVLALQHLVHVVFWALGSVAIELRHGRSFPDAEHRFFFHFFSTYQLLAATEKIVEGFRCSSFFGGMLSGLYRSRAVIPLHSSIHSQFAITLKAQRRRISPNLEVRIIMLQYFDCSCGCRFWIQNDIVSKSHRKRAEEKLHILL